MNVWVYPGAEAFTRSIFNKVTIYTYVVTHHESLVQS